MRCGTTYSQPGSGIQSARLRAAIFDSYAIARRVAMEAAVQAGDWRLLTELVEANRLQTSAAMSGQREDVPVFLDSHDGMAHCWPPAPVPSPNDDTAGQVEVPIPYSYPMQD